MRPARKSAEPKVRLAAAMKAVSSVSNVWLAERLKMGRHGPAGECQSVCAAVPTGWRSYCGVVQCGGVTIQFVTRTAIPIDRVAHKGSRGSVDKRGSTRTDA